MIKKKSSPRFTIAVIGSLSKSPTIIPEDKKVLCVPLVALGMFVALKAGQLHGYLPYNEDIWWHWSNITIKTVAMKPKPSSTGTIANSFKDF